MEQARSALSLRPALVAAVVLMLIWLIAYWHLGQMGWELVQLSSSGPRALALYAFGKYREAGQTYLRGRHGPLRVQYANDPSGYWALYYGHADEAAQRANTTILLVPGSLEPVITLGEIALDRGRASDAMQSFAAVLRRRPDHTDALLLLAVAAAREGDRDRAIDALSRALRSSAAGSRETILYRVIELVGELRERPAGQQRACLLAHLHRYLRIFDGSHGPIAMDFARRAIASGDRPADAYLTLGVVHDKRGEYAEARSAMRHAVALDPRHAEALRWLAVEASNSGDGLAEYQLVRATFEAAPTDPFYYRDLERVVVGKLGDPQGMIKLMERAVALDAGNADAHARLARSADAIGDQARARVHRARAAELRVAAAR